MKKLLFTILFTLVLIGGANAKIKVKKLQVLFKDENKIHIVDGTWGTSLKNSTDVANNYCSSLNKKAFMTRNGGQASRLKETYENKGYKLGIYKWVDEFECRDVLKNTNSSSSYSQQTNQEQSIEFNIKQKKEQCEAIGFTPKTEKFADCVLRLVELDVKQQQDQKIAAAQNSGNTQIANQLLQMRNDASSQYLMNLGQQLLNPGSTNSNIYLPQTQRCTIQGFGTFAKMTCR